jgi:predicted ATPase/class 3 adenylate cyclase
MRWILTSAGAKREGGEVAVRVLPAGRVTLLFTDIEGSTRLMEELGEEGYVEALAEHRRLLRAALDAHGGVEVDTQGDAFLFAFGDAVEALSAAAEGQSALSAGPVSVRMGLHTGELRLTGEGYAGRELHRAARIAASGHGGQVVVSSATRALVGGDLTELGEHRLKDFDEPVPLFQLGRDSFPPLKTISNTNLPRPASSFVGRERERDELVALLGNGTRLLTLSGPGGSGKTRLAVEAASELVPSFKTGVFWVGLAALREPALVTAAIAQTLGSKNGLAEHIGERELLVLLDNFEQVVDAAPELGGLLERCPNLKLMVTSRELLRVNGEVDYPVPPLAEPEAVELFCERSRLPADGTIAELCRRLDDLPLALELAAARTSVLSPAQILERLSGRLDLLKGGRDADPRQQTLRATIEWSHELLEPEEQRLFASLAVFRGGCTVETAEAVAGADLDTLQSLVDKSLLRHTGERFWMLETIREYARERLAASGEEAEMRRRHALFVLDIAEATSSELEAGGDHAVAYARFAAEHDNARAALEWARDSQQGEVLTRLAAALSHFWLAHAHTQEAEHWISLVLERGDSPPGARMTVLRTACIIAVSRRDWERSDALIDEWRRLAEREGDEYQVVRAMNSAALNAAEKGDFEDARAQFAIVVERAREMGARDLVAFVAVNLAEVAWMSGDYHTAIEQGTDAMLLFRESGDDGGVLASLATCSWSALALRDPARGAELFREQLAIAGPLGARRRVFVITSGLAAALVGLHEEERGAQLFGAAASLREDLVLGLDDEGEERLCEQAVAEAKAALGEGAFAAAWSQGEGMTLEEIVALAMPR